MSIDWAYIYEIYSVDARKEHCGVNAENYPFQNSHTVDLVVECRNKIGVVLCRCSYSERFYNEYVDCLEYLDRFLSKLIIEENKSKISLNNYFQTIKKMSFYFYDIGLVSKSMFYNIRNFANRVDVILSNNKNVFLKYCKNEIDVLNYDEYEMYHQEIEYIFSIIEKDEDLKMFYDYFLQLKLFLIVITIGGDRRSAVCRLKVEDFEIVNDREIYFTIIRDKLKLYTTSRMSIKCNVLYLSKFIKYIEKRKNCKSEMMFNRVYYKCDDMYKVCEIEFSRFMKVCQCSTTINKNQEICNEIDIDRIVKFRKSIVPRLNNLHVFRYFVIAHYAMKNYSAESISSITDQSISTVGKYIKKVVKEELKRKLLNDGIN